MFEDPFSGTPGIDLEVAFQHFGCPLYVKRLRRHGMFDVSPSRQILNRTEILKKSNDSTDKSSDVQEYVLEMPMPLWDHLPLSARCKYRIDRCDSIHAEQLAALVRNVFHNCSMMDELPEQAQGV